MIKSPSNERVKRVQAYVQKAKDRKKDDVFVVEGMRMVRETPFASIREVFVSEHYMKNVSDGDREILKRFHAEEVTDAVFAKMSDTKTPQGVIAVVDRFHYDWDDIFGRDPSKAMILVLENIQDPGNLGTMFRSAEGAGVTGIIMNQEMADVYNPKVVRSTMGAIFREPFIYVESVQDAVAKLKDKGVKTYAAHLKGTKSYDDFDYTSPCAFLIGNEGNGLSKEVADSADIYVRIPMLGKVESMNAATSAALLTFEAARQRRNAAK